MMEKYYKQDWSCAKLKFSWGWVEVEVEVGVDLKVEVDATLSFRHSLDSVQILFRVGVEGSGVGWSGRRSHR